MKSPAVPWRRSPAPDLQPPPYRVLASARSCKAGRTAAWPDLQMSRHARVFPAPSYVNRSQGDLFPPRKQNLKKTALQVYSRRTTRDSKSACERIATKRIRKRVGNGVADHVLVLRAQKPAQAVGIHNVFPGHV